MRNTVRQRREIIRPTYVMTESARAASAEIGVFGLKSYVKQLTLLFRNTN